MKLLAILLSFYIFTLAVMPCGDKEDGKLPSADAIEYSIIDQSNHESHSEHCSPFCMCACCGQSMSFSHFQNTIEQKPQIALQKLQEYQSVFVFEASFSIWQPPKFS
jgi:hypothetical protein